MVSCDFGCLATESGTCSVLGCLEEEVSSETFS